VSPITERPAEKTLGGIQIAKSRPEELNGRTARIDRAIQVAPLALYANVGFVHTPRTIGRLQVGAQAPTPFRRKPLNPAPDGGGIDWHASLSE
jgi:hypothetical protein